MGADRASRLINQLLALARAESPVQAPRQRIELGALVEEVTRDWVRSAQDKGIDIGFEPHADAAMIEGNPLLLRELFSNLLDNAIRYTPAGGTITARVGVAGDSVQVDVEDNGTGIPDAERELVFERFYRILGTGKEGSGLGLAIVREIAEVHQGSVQLLPSVRGTLFRVSLPRARATAVPLHRVA